MLTTFSGRRASQNEFELRGFIDLLVRREAKRYLEIGAREGDTFHEVMLGLHAAVDLPHIYGVAVDYPGALWGKKTTAAQLAKAITDLRLRGYEVEALLGDSRSSGVRTAVEQFGPFDAILIDGDHTYEGVKADWENYRHLAPVIAFHDIVGTGQSEKVTGREVEVPRLWAEIKAGGRKTVEFIAPGSAMGIGVVLS